MNPAGSVVIAPQFDREGDFFGGLARVLRNGKWGYANEKGAVTIPFQFDAAGDFSEGLAPVQVSRRWGFVDAAGRLVIRPRFQAAGEFRGGLARFEAWDEVHCDSPERGKSNKPDHYTSDDAPLYAYRLHLTKVPGGDTCFPRDAWYGFVSRAGEVVIAPRFPLAFDFSGGRAAVRMNRYGDEKWGYIDRSGNLVIASRFESAGDFSEGLAAVQLPARPGKDRTLPSQWGFIDGSGAFVVEPRFTAANAFSEGLANVSISVSDETWWGYCDKRGVMVVPPRYAGANPFSDGLAVVIPANVDPDHLSSTHYIDRRGRMVLVLRQWAWFFSGGLTVFGQYPDRKYIDKTGRVVAPYEVDPSP